MPFDSMLSMDDNFNFNFDPTMPPGFDWNTVNPDYSLEELEYGLLEAPAKLEQDSFSQEPFSFFATDHAYLAALGPDTWLPVVAEQNNQALDESEQDLAPLVSAPVSAAPTPVEEHFTSDADLPVEEDEELEDDSNSLFSDTPSAAASPVQDHFNSDADLTIQNEHSHQSASDIEVPASAGAHQPQNDFEDMPLLHQQYLRAFNNGTDQQSFTPSALPSTGAFQNEFHFGSDAETLVDQQQQQIFDTYENFQQSMCEPNIASSNGATQLHSQVNSSPDAPAPMSEQQLVSFRRHMAVQLNRPGLTQQEKYEYLYSIPAHVMDQLRIAHPMPSPQVPAQTSQQSSSMYQESSVSDQPQAQPACDLP